MKSDHERVASSGAWLGFGLGIGLLGWLDLHIPHLLGFLLNWSVVLAVCYGMAAWKRAWYAWAAFWGMAVLCPLAGILQLAGLVRSQWSTGAWLIGCTMCFIWYWLVRLPRKHPAAPPKVSHVVHHHVLHEPGAALPALDAAGHEPRSLPAIVRRAIEAPVIRPEHIAEAVRQAVRRGDRP